MFNFASSFHFCNKKLLFSIVKIPKFAFKVLLKFYYYRYLLTSLLVLTYLFLDDIFLSFSYYSKILFKLVLRISLYLVYKFYILILYVFNNKLIYQISNYLGMTLGTLFFHLLPLVKAEYESPPKTEPPAPMSMFSNGGLYYLMGALICGNLLQRLNPYFGRYRALGALADTSLWGIPALITWSGYNWGSISYQVKQLVLGSLRSYNTLEIDKCCEKIRLFLFQVKLFKIKLTFINRNL